MHRHLPLLLCACLLAAGEQAPPVGTIGLRELVPLLNSQRARLVDCRGAAAYAKAHARSAIDGSLPAEELKLFLPLDPADPVILYGADAKDQGHKEVAQKFAGCEVVLQRFAEGHAGLVKIRMPMVKGKMQELPAKLPGHKKFKGRAYLIEVGKVDAGIKPALLVWCHPASGTPGPEFEFWKSSRLFGKNVILLCPKAWGQGWESSLDERFVHELVAEVMAEHGVDPAKVVFGGHSSGAIFTLNYAIRHPGRYRHLVVAAGTLPGEPPKAGDDPPAVSLYHSKNDKLFKWQSLERMKAALEKQGYPVHLTEDQQGHGIGAKLVERMKVVLAEVGR